jgi:hypothetical protein
MFEKVIQLLRLLLQETRANRVEWEFFSEDNMIRAKVGDGLLRIERQEGVRLEDISGRVLENATVYNIWVIDSKGAVCDEFVLTPLEPDYHSAKELFELARRKARNTNEVLDDMIRALTARS